MNQRQKVQITQGGGELLFSVHEIACLLALFERAEACAGDAIVVACLILVGIDTITSPESVQCRMHKQQAGKA